MNRTLLRRLLLFGTGLTFLAIAVVSWIIPTTVAAQYSLTLDTPGSWNQFRAVYAGFWVGLFVLMATAARRVEDARLGDLCAILILCQALARGASLVCDGVPESRFLAAAGGELATALAILALRPQGGAHGA